MPFHGFADWQDCIDHVSASADDPEAVCGALKAAAEGKSVRPFTVDEVRKLCASCAEKMVAAGITRLHTDDLLAFLKSVPAKPQYGIAKTNDAERLVFGWASVSQDAKGALLQDLQGDTIEPAELEKAAYNFMFYGGAANEMHQGPMKGRVVESLMLTDDKLKSMGLQRTSAPAAAWWVGLKLEPDTYAKVKSGQYKMFSIKGYSDVEEAA